MPESDGGFRTGGWATSSIDNSIRRAFIVAVGFWQLVLVGAALVDRSGVAYPGAVAVVHLFYACLAVTALQGRLPHAAFVGLGMAIILADFAVATSLNTVLAFAAVWTLNLFHLVPVMVLRGRWRWLFMAVDAVALPVAVFGIHPEWTADLPIAAFGTSVAMQTAAWFALRFFARLGRTVDGQAERSAAEQQAAAVGRVRSTQGRESVRVLHDTVINTLGAIASGGGAVRDRSLVQARCERDILTMAALERGQLEGTTDVGRPWSELRLLGPVEFSGLSPDDLDHLMVRVPAPAARSMRAVAHEAALNALKHAGVETVYVVARETAGGGLDIAVRDQGRGISHGSADELTVRRSMVERAQSAGIDVDVRTVPGGGTDVIIAFRPDAEIADTPVPQLGQDDVAGFVVRIRRQASWAAALGTAAVGIAIELVNQSGQLTWTYATVAMVFAAAGLTAISVRRHGALTRWAAALLVLASPVAFLATLPAVDFGGDDPYLWQAITAAPLVVLLLEFGRSRWPVALALAAIWLMASAVGALTMARSPDGAGIVIVGTIALSGVVAGWASFRGSMSEISHRAALDYDAAMRARVELAARVAADEAMERWRAAGLHSSLDLLRRIVAGEADPADPGIQSCAAEEESFLRQLIMLSPDSVYMNPWFHRVLVEARERGVVVRLRSADIDVDSRDTAEVMGSLLRRIVESATPDQQLSITFGGRGGIGRLGIVGPGDTLRFVKDGWSAPAGWLVSSQDLGDEAIVEVTS